MMIRNEEGEGEKLWRWALWSCLTLCGIYLLVCHYVQDYSDPVGFVERAMSWEGEGDRTDRAPLYPLLVHAFILLVGRDWVFLSNLPFLVLAFLLVAQMTRRTWRSGEGGRKDGAAGWFAVFAVLLLFAARRDLWLQLVNPYREPLTLILVLGSVLLLHAGWARGAKRMVFGAGLALGLATSVRETALLMVVPMGLWLLSQVISERRVRWVLWGLLIGGVLIGMGPLLYKNYSYSGQALVPAYSAGRVAAYAERGQWDIPVPGMSIHHFSDTAPETLRQTVAAYTPAGVVAFVTGLLIAAWRRNRFILALLFPACLIYFVFYFFYNRYLSRYLLAGEVFAIPIMVYGAAGMWRGVEAGLRTWKSAWIPRLRRGVVGGLLLCFFAWLLPPIFKADGRTKAWNLATIRAELLDHVEEPAVFLGNRHFAFRMSWLLDQSAYEYTLRFHDNRTAFDTFEQRLASQGEDTIERFAAGNYYIDDSSFALAANWLRRIPVFDLANLSVPFERYGRPVSGTLYRVRLWNQDELILEGEAPRPERAVLMLDMRRPWDYPGRTYLTGSEGPDGASHGLSNAVQFIEIESNSSNLEQSFAFHIR